MAKQSRRSTQTQRIRVVMDVLERWGRMDKNQITSLVASQIDENPESEAFERAIYRDLKDLVEDQRVQVDYFSRDGALIDDYDPDVHKNVYCQWYLSGSEGLVSGSGHLNSLNGIFHAPKLIKNDISIITGNSQADPRHRQIFFQIGETFISIKVSFQALPFKIVVSRIHGELTKREIDKVTKEFGLRACILKLPFPKLSSFKENGKSGHFLIEFESENSLAITDLESSNGTFIYKLTFAEADKVRQSGAKMNQETLTSTWDRIDINFLKPVKINNKMNFEIPSLVDAGGDFKCLVV